MTRQNNSKRASLHYDSYGRPLRNKKQNGFLHFLLRYLLPYLVINGLILFLVITKPRIEASEPDTTDYQHASISFRLHSVLPMRSITASLEGEPVEFVKNGKNYSADLSANGNLTISVESLNRMTDTEHISINILDENSPAIDENSVDIGSGYVEFQVTDSQSGVDFDNVYAVNSNGDKIKPTNVNKAQGIITFAMEGDVLNVYVSDFAGNQQTATFSLTM